MYLSGDGVTIIAGIRIVVTLVRGHDDNGGRRRGGRGWRSGVRPPLIVSGAPHSGDVAQRRTPRRRWRMLEVTTTPMAPPPPHPALLPEPLIAPPDT